MNFSRALGATAKVFSHRILFGAADPAGFAAITVPDRLAASPALRQRDFRAGRLCAITALNRAGLALPIEINCDDDGLPVWPPGWRGSISHCRFGAIAMVARNCLSVGIDMEPWLDPAAARDIAPHIATPAELDLVPQLSPDQRLTLIFSAKEALFKALFPETRHFLDFSAAAVRSASPQKLSLELTVDWSPRWRRGACFDLTCQLGRDFVVTALLVTAGDDDGHL